MALKERKKLTWTPSINVIISSDTLWHVLWISVPKLGHEFWLKCLLFHYVSNKTNDECCSIKVDSFFREKEGKATKELHKFLLKYWNWTPRLSFPQLWSINGFENAFSLPQDCTSKYLAEAICAQQFLLSNFSKILIILEFSKFKQNRTFFSQSFGTTIQKNGCSALKVRMRAADYYVNARHISTICSSFPKKSDNIDAHSKCV